MWIYLLPVLMGMALAMQTAVNARLRVIVQSPLLATTISFLIGTLFVMGVMVFQGEPFVLPVEVMQTIPWWQWLGGLIGVYVVMMYIVLFNKIGGIQATILPIFGQIVMGILIDQFGWFQSPVVPLTIRKSIGIAWMLLGILLTIGVIGKRPVEKRDSNAAQHAKWQLIAILTGMAGGVQAAIGGAFTVAAGSPLYVVFISFSLGTVALMILAWINKDSFSKVKQTKRYMPHQWWIWLGGLLGAFYLLGNNWLIPQVGTAQVMIITLFGQLFFSAVIEHVGLFSSVKIPVSRAKVIGLCMMFLGVMTLNL